MWVLLTRRPTSPDVTEAEVVVIAGVGSAQVSVPPELGFLEDGRTIDPIALAERLLPEAKHRLFAFASKKVEGWECIDPAASWADLECV